MLDGKVSDQTRYKRFQERYWEKPHLFALNCISWPNNEQPAPYQLEILEQLIIENRVSARGPRGLGKSALSSIALIWYALTRDGYDWKVPTTASVWAQLIQFLWPEVHKWIRYLKWDLIGRPAFKKNSEIFTLKLTLDTGSAFAVTSDDPQRIEGGHADYILYIFDESKIIQNPTWDSAEGALSTGIEKLWLAVSTPGEPVGRFFDIHDHTPGYEDWWVRHVTLQEAVDAGRVDAIWAEDRKNQWGERSTMYVNQVLGDFASTGEETVIPAGWVDAAMERGRDRLPEKVYPVDGPDFSPVYSDHLVTHFGIDVARKGGDQTIFFPRTGIICHDPIRRGAQDTMVTAGDILNLFRRWPNAIAIIDVIGVGAGVYDRVMEVLREEDYWRNRSGSLNKDILFPFVSSGHTKWADHSMQLKFRDVRSAAWWNMRQLLDPAYGSEVCLPYNRELREELAAPGFEALSDGRIKVEAKDDIRDRIGRSTNLADAVIMSFWDEAYNVGMEYA